MYGLLSKISALCEKSVKHIDKIPYKTKDVPKVLLT